MSTLLKFLDKTAPGVDPVDFAPDLLRIQEKPPAPLARGVLKVLFLMLAALLIWAAIGKLDIVAVADGKLVPSSYIKIVQPAEQGVVREILVREGEAVQSGQVLIRMDPVLANADVASLTAEYHTKRLALRRIDAELASTPFVAAPGDPPAMVMQAMSQHRANTVAYENALNSERIVLERASHDLSAATEIRAKLEKTLPHYREQERAYEKLTQDGYTGRLMFTDKQRERIEKEQDLRTQEFTVRAVEAASAQSEKKLLQITADYRRQLFAERVDTSTQMEKARQELAKNSHRHGQLELKAPQAGAVKDLATHTVGTVASPGTILMTLVPSGDVMLGEVWVRNEDIGFVRPGQQVRVKLRAFPFQKYGILEGVVEQVSADATEAPPTVARSDTLSGRDRPMGQLAYRAIVNLKHQHLESDGRKYALGSGMHAVVEINLGKRTVLEYLLSPVQKAFHEAARER